MDDVGTDPIPSQRPDVRISRLSVEDRDDHCPQHVPARRRVRTRVVQRTVGTERVEQPASRQILGEIHQRPDRCHRCCHVPLDLIPALSRQSHPFPRLICARRRVILGLARNVFLHGMYLSLSHEEHTEPLRAFHLLGAPRIPANPLFINTLTQINCRQLLLIG